MRRWLLSGVLALLVGCSSTGDHRVAAPSPGTTPEVQPTRIVVQVGAASPVRAEIADTPSERSRGLMGRSELAPGTGMLFVFAEPSTSSFFMWRTLVPLSIAFVDVDRVVSVAEMTPCAETSSGACPRYDADGPYTLAIEAPAGWFTDPGVRRGDPVTLDPQPAPATS